MIMQTMIEQQVSKVKRDLELRFEEMEDAIHNARGPARVGAFVDKSSFEEMAKEGNLFREFNHGSKLRESKTMAEKSNEGE